MARARGVILGMGLARTAPGARALGRSAATLVMACSMATACVTETESVDETEAAVVGTDVCAFDEIECSGECVDILEDPFHCGGCNAVCSAESECSEGRCVATSATADGGARLGDVVAPRRCAASQSFCMGACINTSTDNTNCGGCDLVCTAGTTCIAGRCRSEAELRGVPSAGPRSSP